MVHPVLRIDNNEVNKLKDSSNPSTSRFETSLDSATESALTQYLCVNLADWIPPMVQGSAPGGDGSAGISNSNDNGTSASTSPNENSTCTSTCFSSGSTQECSDNEVTSSTTLKSELKVENSEMIFIEDPINRQRPVSPPEVEDYKDVAATLGIPDSAVASSLGVVAPPPFKKQRQSSDKTFPDIPIPERYVEESHLSHPWPTWPPQPKAIKPNAKKSKDTEKAIHPPITVIYAAEIERLKLINRDHVRMTCTLEKQNKALKEYLYTTEEKVENLDLQLRGQNELVKTQRRMLNILTKKFQFNHCFLQLAKLSNERIHELTQETLDHLVPPEHKDATIEFLEAQKDNFVSTGYWAWGRGRTQCNNNNTITPSASATPES